VNIIRSAWLNVWLELGCWACSLESFDEGFGYDVAPAISFSAHTARDSMAAAKGKKLSISVCYAAVGVQYHWGRWTAISCGHSQCW
jgi:hypothetical protein